MYEAGRKIIRDLMAINRRVPTNAVPPEEENRRQSSNLRDVVAPQPVELTSIQEPSIITQQNRMRSTLELPSLEGVTRDHLQLGAVEEITLQPEVPPMVPIAEFVPPEVALVNTGQDPGTGLESQLLSLDITNQDKSQSNNRIVVQEGCTIQETQVGKNCLIKKRFSNNTSIFQIPELVAPLAPTTAVQDNSILQKELATAEDNKVMKNHVTNFLC